MHGGIDFPLEQRRRGRRPNEKVKGGIALAKSLHHRHGTHRVSEAVAGYVKGDLHGAFSSGQQFFLFEQAARILHVRLEDFEAHGNKKPGGIARLIAVENGALDPGVFQREAGNFGLMGEGEFRHGDKGWLGHV